MRTFAAVLALTFALAAQADSLGDEADFRFRRGATLYREGKVEEALGEFLASNRLVPNRNVAFNIARCFEQLKRFNEAYRWYTEILAQPELSQEDRKNVDDALQRISASLALVRIETDPPGATVYIDRKDLGGRGQTPLQLALPQRPAKVLVELPGYRGAETSIAPAIGKIHDVRLKLERIMGALVLHGEPADFAYEIDGVRGAPLTLVPGPHTVHLSRDGYAPQDHEVRVPPDGQAELQFTLIKLPQPSGTIVVKANLDGAVVKVDGQDEGFTPAFINARVGQHKVEVVREGREPVVETVTVREGQRTPVDVKLRYAVPRVQAAERQLTRASDAPASITIISREEIRNFGYQTLAEALRSVRGLYITDDRDYSSVGVRGFSPPGTYNSRVLVLSDGHITNDLSLGQGFIGHDFDTDLFDVDRIEVVRGPGSVQYGSSAYLAVINVVHRPPAKGAHMSGGVVFLGQETVSASGSYAPHEDRWIDVHAGVFHTAGDDFNAPAPLSRTLIGMDSESAAHADLRARYGDFTLQLSMNDRTKAIPTAPFDTAFGFPGTSDHDQRFFGEANWSHEYSTGLTLDARLSYDGRRHKSWLEYNGPDGNAHPGFTGRIADWGEGEVRVRLPTLYGNRLFAGGIVQDVFRVKLDSFTPAGSDAGLTASPDRTYSETILSAYAGDDFRVSQRVSIDAAIRLDDYVDAFGVVANPRVALVSQPYDGGNFKLIYGTAYRAPSFYERYFSNGALQVAGNRCTATGTCFELQPESIRTGEFEHTHNFSDSTSLLVAGYWSRIANILRLTGASDAGRGAFAFGNRSTLTHSAGLEGELRWQPEPGALLSAWYSWTTVLNEISVQGCPFDPTIPQRFVVPNVPWRTGALRGMWPLADTVSISSELVYGSNRDTVFVDCNNQETAVGASLNWNIGVTGTLGRGGPRFAMHVLNVLDDRPILPAGLEVPFAPRAIPQQGRTFRATLGGAF